MLIWGSAPICFDVLFKKRQMVQTHTCRASPTRLKKFPTVEEGVCGFALADDAPRRRSSTASYVVDWVIFTLPWGTGLGRCRLKTIVSRFKEPSFVVIISLSVSVFERSVSFCVLASRKATRQSHKNFKSLISNEFKVWTIRALVIKLPFYRVALQKVEIFLSPLGCEALFTVFGSFPVLGRSKCVRPEITIAMSYLLELSVVKNAGAVHLV